MLEILTLTKSERHSWREDTTELISQKSYQLSEWTLLHLALKMIEITKDNSNKNKYNGLRNNWKQLVREDSSSCLITFILVRNLRRRLRVSGMMNTYKRLQTYSQSILTKFFWKYQDMITSETFATIKERYPCLFLMPNQKILYSTIFYLFQVLQQVMAKILDSLNLIWIWFKTESTTWRWPFWTLRKLMDGKRSQALKNGLLWLSILRKNSA